MTPVVIRRWKKNGDLIVLFPTLQQYNGLVTSYEHIGQHGDDDWDTVIRQTVSTSPDESDVFKLLEELVDLGYLDLEPVARRTRSVGYSTRHP